VRPNTQEACFCLFTDDDYLFFAIEHEIHVRSSSQMRRFGRLRCIPGPQVSSSSAPLDQRSFNPPKPKDDPLQS
jgi:hypothetical protein